jgi:hypothetical protein
MSTPRGVESEEDTAEKRQHSFHLNQQLYESFRKMARLLGRTSVSEALQEAMMEWVKTHKDELPSQIVIEMVEPKQANMTLANRLELKIVKDELGNAVKILENLVNEKPPRKVLIQDWQKILRKNLPKALTLYKKTKDSELEQLLAKVEQLMDV